MSKNQALSDDRLASVERHAEAAIDAKRRDHQRLKRKPGPETWRKGGIEVTQRNDDAGTPERNAKGDLVDLVTDTTKGKRSIRAVPLDHYRDSNALDPRDRRNNARLYRSGDRLRREWQTSKLTPRMTSDLLGAGGNDAAVPGAMTDRALDAFTRYARAMRVVGVVLSPVLVHVVCLEGTARQWALGRGVRLPAAQTAGMTALRLALDALARHYGDMPPEQKIT